MCTEWTHAFAGVAIARLASGRKMPWYYWGLAAILPIIPDFDAFSTHGYDDSPFAHRGLTHSLVFALALGLGAAAISFRKLKVSYRDLGGLFFMVAATHAILDALNKNTAGVALFWPFSSARYGPWGPIPVPDIAVEIPDPRTSRAVRGELLWVWLPLSAAMVAVTAYRMIRTRRRGRESIPRSL
jgi:inner membrane protein